MINLRAGSLIAVLALVSACGGSGGAGGAPRPSQDQITAAEIQQQHFSNTYDLISALRPSWLRSRSPTFGTSGQIGVVVYLDGNRLGSADYLRQIAVGQIESARYLNGAEATSRYGTNHASGAILVTSRKQ
ncbi:MAG: hypothetical protein FIB01_16440 [Gemmatimonadetes bacterium]|nr:hypothetical protein [Gemmatimonadota bacterium]